MSPRAPHVPCRRHLQGCPALVDPADKNRHHGYCPACLVATNRQHEQQRANTPTRKLANTARAQRFLKSFRVRNPVCATPGCGRATQVADHIIPHCGDPALFYDYENLQPLCKQCHDTKTAKEDGGWGNL